MGRGDKKSRQGKIWRGSYGKRRPKGKGRKSRVREGSATKSASLGAREKMEAGAAGR